MRTFYHTPDGRAVSAPTARRLIHGLAARIDHKLSKLPRDAPRRRRLVDAYGFAHSRWQAVAARPETLWRDLLELAT